MIAELLRRLVEDQPRAVGDERGQGVVAIARRFEDIAAGDSGAFQIAGLAGQAELIFGAVVIGLQIRIAERPIGERGILGYGAHAIPLYRPRAVAEIILMHAP